MNAQGNRGILVLGASGLIGRFVTDDLRMRGFHVIAVARSLSPSQRSSNLDLELPVMSMDAASLARLLTDHAVDVVREALNRGLPVFGICFGNQVLGRALGFGTYKLRYGHHGINQPVQERMTGKVEVTAHNHGFAVDAPLDGPTSTPYGSVLVSHVCLNDDVVEGLDLRGDDGTPRAFSVQYHPEAAAGPHDAGHLFDRFVNLMLRAA